MHVTSFPLRTSVAVTVRLKFPAPLLVLLNVGKESWAWGVPPDHPQRYCRLVLFTDCTEHVRLPDGLSVQRQSWSSITLKIKSLNQHSYGVKTMHLQYFEGTPKEKWKHRHCHLVVTYSTAHKPINDFRQRAKLKSQNMLQTRWKNTCTSHTINIYSYALFELFLCLLVAQCARINASLTGLCICYIKNSSVGFPKGLITKCPLCSWLWDSLSPASEV